MRCMIKQNRSSLSSKGNNNNKNEDSNNLAIDKTDRKIVKLLVTGNTNAQISSKLNIPLSTIQRRTRRMISSGLVIPKAHLNYEMFGFTTGMLHIYVKDGNMLKTAKKINSDIEGVISTEIHIGNSDIVADYIYRKSIELLDTMSIIKKLEGVERIVWSEKVLQLPSKEDMRFLDYIQ